MQQDVSAKPMTLSERADALEEQMMHELEHIVTKSVLFNLADGKVEMEGGNALLAKNPGKFMLMGADPRLPKMPEKPTLVDYFRCRFAPPPICCERDSCAESRSNEKSCSPACCTTSRRSFIRCDHGYWGAQ